MMVQETSTLMYKIEKYEAELLQARQDADHYREAVQNAKNQVKLVEDALNSSEETVQKHLTRISQLEQELKAFEVLKQRSQATVSGLQKVVQESRDQIITLETQLRQLKETKEQDMEKQQADYCTMTKLFSQLAIQLGLSGGEMDFGNVYQEILERMDKLTISELKHAQTEAMLAQARQELEVVKQKAEDVVAQYGQTLTERKRTEEKLSQLTRRNAELSSELDLLKNTDSSKETRLAELTKELEQISNERTSERKRTQEANFRADVAGIQWRSLLESMAASLSTCDFACEPTETGVKDALAKLIDHINLMKQNGSKFLERVEGLQKQFKSQSDAEMLLTNELATARQRLCDLETSQSQRDKENLELRLKIQDEQGQKQQTLEHSRTLCRLFNIPIETISSPSAKTILEKVIDATEQLINHGCISAQCLDWIRTRNPDHTHQIPIVTRSTEPQCTHELANNLIHSLHHGDTSNFILNEATMRQLCLECSKSLLSVLLGHVKQTEGRNIQDTSPRDSSKKLQSELEDKNQQIEELYNIINILEAKMQEDKRLITKLQESNSTRQSQSKRVEKLTKQLMAESLETKQSQEALKTAKRLLMQTQDRKVRLSRFFDLLGRLVNVDTRFEHNPEMAIIHRVQQLIEVLQQAGIYQVYNPQPFAIGPSRPPSAEPSMLPGPGSAGLYLPPAPPDSSNKLQRKDSRPRVEFGSTPRIRSASSVDLNASKRSTKLPKRTSHVGGTTNNRVPKKLDEQKY